MTLPAAHSSSTYLSRAVSDEKRLRELTFLHETSQVLTATLDLKNVLRSLMVQVRDYFQVEAASVALLDEETGELVFQVAVGRASEDVIGLRLAVGQGIAGWVVQTGQPTLVPAAHSDERFYSGVDDATDFRTQTLLAVPIQVEGQTIGVIEAINPRQGHFDEDAQRLLSSVADLAAAAIRNAALYERVRQAERRYESLFNESADPILVLDLEGRILTFNRRMAEMVDWRREEMYGVALCEALGEVVTGDFDPTACRAAIAQARAGERVNMKLNLHVQSSSACEPRVLDLTLYRVNYGGRDAIQCIGHDVSERVAFEKMRDDLTQMIIHDLRNPLGSIMSILQLLHTALVEQDQSLPFGKLLGIAMRSGQKMHRLIDSLLSMGRLESGQAEIHTAPTPPHLLVQEAVDQIHPLTLSRNITMEVQVAPDLPEVTADRDLLVRVLTNLMDNAVKFMIENGHITVRAEPHPEGVLFAVSDSGPGIPPEFHQRIFDRFARLERVGGVNGVGLGLAFCKLAVEAHHGHIWVESEPEHGATFYFTLPVKSGSRE